MAFSGTESAVAYFPGYHCNHRDGFVSSNQKGNGPLGFAEHIDAPINWENLDDIGEQQLKIGTVLGYAKVGTGWIRAIPAKNDVTNLKKLQLKRIDAVVIDKYVLEYLKATDEDLRAKAGTLRFNLKPLEDKTLHLCVRNKPGLEQLVNDFNAGFEQIDAEKNVRPYFENAFN